jgi:RimJ/RimL family protein N-acetyltransferase
VALRDTVYPVSTKRTEEWIKDDVAPQNPGEKQDLAIVRKSDDVIIGSAKVESEGDVMAWLNARVDTLYGDQAQHWRAEAITLLVDYLVDERQSPSVTIEISTAEEIVVSKLMAAGMVETARFRESRRVGDRYFDLVALQKFNPNWLETLGDPMEMPLERTGTGQPRPVPVKVEPLPKAPKNAILVGKRVYLRPISKEDPKEETPWTRKETETFFDIGRHLPSTAGTVHWYTELEKKETPDWIHLAVCLRENDQYIGNVMLIGVDYVNKRAETGSWFFRGDYRGSGYGSEAKHLLLEYAFEVLGLHMLQSWVYFPNTRSAAALRKQGYRECGRICWVYRYDGGFSNFVVFDLLADEWRAMPRQDWG